MTIHATFDALPCTLHPGANDADHTENQGSGKRPFLLGFSAELLFGDEFTTKTKGGFVVYYVSPGKGGRKSQSCFRCCNGPDFGGDNLTPCANPNLDTEELPNKPCYGIRSNILYPTYASFHFPFLISLSLSLSLQR
ncbi:hypothetical protein MYCTH_2111553 [Thermothelomyces thermophilus ATCC 42464]|uniref:Uncharacterized protein n=1 Tax=Thermothelomyces thermophilus (strain ATCC 42464 / BCRC 31852 / DSM 1799) TaxID=573729 RepID=G2QG89_THET4|nr:uncharacterized protein MYCTH_2111553 [Thermothelomyces thermophilus ATCC 42464]AEO59349.1 hypothetical protein MYCTH_2111553 [Thermothelomyces thermophilus ATCC 42464]